MECPYKRIIKYTVESWIDGKKVQVPCNRELADTITQEFAPCGGKKCRLFNSCKGTCGYKA